LSVAYDPQLFLEIANSLLTDKEYEEKGRIRTAIGRAYYAAFLSAKKELQEIGYSFADVHRLHKDVIETSMTKNSMIGNRLDTLHDHRIAADYEMMADITLSLGKTCVRLSELIIRSLGQLK